MTVTEISADISREEKEILEAVHNFANTVMRPTGIELDKYSDPNQVIAPDSPLWNVFQKYQELGVDMFELSSTGLPPSKVALLSSMISEELGWGDSGLAISLEVSIFPRALAMLSGNSELIEQFGSAKQIGCWAITEPDHGSDVIYFGDKLNNMPGKPNCIAKKTGDYLEINGQKAAWVSNGTIAKNAALFCAVDMGEGIAGLGGILVDLTLPGVSRGSALDKLGQRALNQGEIFFDNVKVPLQNMVISPEMGSLGSDMGLSMANAGMGATFVGVSRASFELAVEYAKQRVQFGVPIIQHQSVKSRLFKMYRKLEAARYLSRQAVLCNGIGTPNLKLSIASKVTSTQSAFEISSEAIQIFGGNGLAKAYPVEKLMRDARASMIEDGCNEVLGMLAAERF
jgi:alkylation response protein AidB-like acyl-CoA dehydrogenase